MNIHGIQSTNYFPKFSGWNRNVFRQANTNDIKYRNDTYFYRTEKMWPKLVDFLAEKFKKEAKVNVYEYGCSNGSETYTFVMQMLTSHSEESKKFFPIIAKDLDREAIRIAKSKKIPIGYYEKEVIEKNTKRNISEFFDLKSNYGNNMEYDVKPNLYDNVIFERADILQDYKKIKRQNTVVIARNFWPYLEPYDIHKLASKLGSRLKEGSVLVIGDYDTSELFKAYGINIYTVLQKCGFKTTPIKHVFEKTKLEL